MKTLLSLILAFTFSYTSAQQIVANLQAPVQYIDSNTNFSSKSVFNDTDGDGNTNSIKKYTYDVNGKITIYSQDQNANGMLDYIETSTYDADGNLAFKNIDSNGNGITNFIDRYTYDANGNNTSIINDYDADGGSDFITTFTYDVNGNLTSLSRDWNADNNPDEIYIYTYDANNNQLSESYDINGDGTADNLRTYTYDSNGNLIVESNDSNLDGNANDITTYSYDSNGNQLSESVDLGADGNPEAITTYTYDGNGNSLTKSYDSDGDGTDNSIWTYVYNYNGDLISESYDLGIDGIINKTILHSIQYYKSCIIFSERSNKMYKVNIPEAGEWTISTCSDNTNFDAKLIIGSTECNQDLGEDADFCTDNKAELNLTFTAPQDIYVIILGENNELGNFELSVNKVVSSISDLKENNKVSVFPNPTSSFLNIDIEDNKNVQYKIFNINGQLLKNGVLENIRQINIQELKNGFYTISLKQKNTIYKASFVVNK